MSNIITILNLVNDAILMSLVNTTLQMTLLIPLIAFVIWLFRIKSAATRYSLWLFVLFALIALPLLTPFIPQIDFVRSNNHRTTADGPDDLMRWRMAGGNVGEFSEGGDSMPSMGTTKTALRKESDVSWLNPVSVAYFICCAGAFLMFCITLSAYRKLRQLRLSSTDVEEHAVLKLLSRLERQAKVGKSVLLKTCSEIYTPISLGIFSHTIILPDGMIDNSSSDELEMILTHELAHIKRRDYLINVLQNLMRAIFFFHPLFHLLNRNLTREREHICDDWVIDMTKRRQRYAECIIGLLENALYQPINLPVTIAMAERKRDIPRRIDMITDKKRRIAAKVSRRTLIAMLLIGFLALPLIGGIGLVRLSGARPASDKGRIVFHRQTDLTIWVMDADGKNQTQLTTAKNAGPAWSPDGRRIAFYHFHDNSGIYVTGISEPR